MKILKIDGGKGLFLVAGGTSYKDIDKMTKEDLLSLAQMALIEDAECDPFNEAVLHNQAHQIIYRSICDKLMDLSKRRVAFKDESDRMFLEAFRKYSTEP